MEAVDSSGQLTFGIIKDNYDNEYRGEILNGQANGFGTKTYKDGRVFKGKFKDNKRVGEGILLRPDGTKYIGQYKNDVQDGIGKNFSKEGKELVGLFKDGKVVKGQSIMYYDEPDNDQMHFTIKYEGDYKNGKRDGKAIFTLDNGDRYEGEFQKDRFWGYGKYIWSDGDVYEGGFKNNKKEGKGKLIFTDGTVINAIWRNDNPIIDLDT